MSDVRHNRTGRLFCFALVAFVVLAFTGCESRKEAAVEGSVRNTLPNEGEAAIPFRIKTLSGGEWSFDAAKGKPVVINFWASWCGPCRAEASTLEKVYLAYRETGVEFVGVAIQDTESGAKKFVEEFKLTFPMGLDESGDIARSYRIFGVPKTFVVGKDGKFTFIHTGDISEEMLSKEIRKVL